MAALGKAYLDSTSRRIKWFEWMDQHPQNVSVMSKLEGNGKGQGTVLNVSNNMVGNTFYSEAASILDGVVYGYDSTLAGNEVGQALKSEAGYRSLFRFAARVDEIDQSKTDRDLLADVKAKLLPHWARTKDQMIVDALSVYSYAAATLTGPATTAQLVYIQNPSHATNIASLNAILNLAKIGTSGCASNLGANVFFCGYAPLTTEPITQPDANTLQDALDHPEAYLLKADNFAYLKDYGLARGMFPAYMKNGKADFSNLIFLAPTPVITELRQRDNAYRQAVISGDISSEEMWTGEMRLDTIHGITHMPFDHNFPDTVTGIKGGTALRVQASTNGRYWIAECLLVGAQSGVICNYRNGNAQIVRRTDTDYENFEGIAYKVITGAQKRHRLSVPDDTTNTMYNNVCSVICAYRKWN